MPRVSLLFHDVYESDPRESGFASDAADRYKLPIADFDAQLAGLASLPQPTCGAGLYGPPRLTFDDGGVSYYTHIADRLETLGWRGHCFMTTDFIGTQGFLTAPQLRELDARGHVIGSHSASHPTRFSTLTAEQMREEWSRSRAVLEDILGRAVEVASVPGGYFSSGVARSADEAGLRTLFTSEPTTGPAVENQCALVGRFTIRRGHPAHIARKFVEPAPWTRCSAWATWNAKGLVKPLLGPTYMRVADWLHASQNRRHA
jgi:peptidoglycan/xylan/chitin deacetylase (PgdA/CDA1 family)